jgi:hypothetical protein
MITTYFHNTMQIHHTEVTWSWPSDLLHYSVCKFTDHETISEYFWIKWKVPIFLRVEEILAGVIDIMDNSDTSSYMIYCKWIPLVDSEGLCQWCTTVRIALVRHCAASRKVAGSSPDEVAFLNSPNPSGRTMALGSTQPLTEMSTRNL